ncbi:hypothetical protein EAG_13341 [Camponotus floridanus]|uniref:Uncharacterized protein n=1 Tax=Camponotus floridanus TaxID=104421 RepID=E2A5N7_CAMFO|nr:hypothetical protein EAG_13341 [Camponotus floridanus]
MRHITGSPYPLLSYPPPTPAAPSSVHPTISVAAAGAAPPMVPPLRPGSYMAEEVLEERISCVLEENGEPFVSSNIAKIFPKLLRMLNFKSSKSQKIVVELLLEFPLRHYAICTSLFMCTKDPTRCKSYSTYRSCTYSSASVHRKEPNPTTESTLRGGVALCDIFGIEMSQIAYLAAKCSSRAECISSSFAETVDSAYNCIMWARHSAYDRAQNISVCPDRLGRPFATAGYSPMLNLVLYFFHESTLRRIRQEAEDHRRGSSLAGFFHVGVSLLVGGTNVARPTSLLTQA